MKKKRVVIYLEPAQLAALKALQRKTGTSLAELCRRAVDDCLRLLSKKTT